MALNDRIREAMNGAGLKPADLARATKKSGGAVTQWLDGTIKSLKAETAERIQQATGYSSTWLVTGKGEKLAKKATPSQSDEAEAQSMTASLLGKIQKHSGSGSVLIPEFETGGAMGNGGLVLEDIQPGAIKSWHVDQEWLHKNVPHHTGNKNLCIVTGFGRSMEPVYNAGDPLLCDRGVQSVDGEGVYFFRIGNHGFIKQLQRIPTEDGMVYRAKSYNSDFDTFDITPKMDFAVLGRILTAWCSKKLW